MNILRNKIINNYYINDINKINNNKYNKFKNNDTYYVKYYKLIDTLIKLNCNNNLNKFIPKLIHLIHVFLYIKVNVFDTMYQNME